MTRRELLAIAGSGLILSSLPSTLKAASKKKNLNGSSRLFFEREDIPKIRANAKSKLLNPLYQEWAAIGADDLDAAWDKFEKTGEIVRDFAQAVEMLAQLSLVQIVSPSQAREDALISAVTRLASAEKWDYFLDGDKPLGIQRASMANVRLLFAREVLQDRIDADLDKKILKAVAEKGCLPCYRTVFGMDNPDTVIGWGFDERHQNFYDLSMERWPMILGANNLRGAPTNALGIGALALLGHDPRAQKWLDAAVSSSYRILDLFSPDGSYFEGISYSGYTLRTILNFFDAHTRAGSDIDWSKEANFEGIAEYILSMQAGVNEDGTPDVVNFSDARTSVYPCVPSWITKYTGSSLAQFATENATLPKTFLDFLWYDASRPSSPPPESLKNVRNDLDWVLCRSGWEADDAVLAFRSGGPCNHEHADRNHITYKAFGERLLTDLFGAAYDKRDPGWIMRHTEAHNSVLVDGRGNHYHEGEEGTNDSKSYAAIVQYEDHGDLAWWTSDATAAYLIDNDHITKVLRTVVFAKPDIVIILDQVRLHFAPQSMSVRFFPDNRDRAAKLTANENGFEIARPKAHLTGTFKASSTLSVSSQKLDVPETTGNFPFIEAIAPPAYKHDVITVLRANPLEAAPPNVNLKQVDGGWVAKGKSFEVKIDTTRTVPSIRMNA